MALPTTPPVLVVVGGLPASGKSTICRELAVGHRLAWLRVDRIEDAIARSTAPGQPVGTAGYAVAYAVAEEQLRCGVDVVVECVNPLPETRDAWVEVAAGTGASIVEVEVVCSDPAEHRRRAEGRTVDIDGLRLPTWDDILARDYRPWDREHLVVDTAATSLPDAVARIVRAGWGERRAPTTEAPPPAERDEP